MEYVYAALLLHAMGKKIDEQAVASLISSAGGTPDSAKAKALVASLEGVNIDEAIKNAAMPVAAPVAAAPAAAGKAPPKKDEKTEEAKAEEASAGLANLFG